MRETRRHRIKRQVRTVAIEKVVLPMDLDAYSEVFPLTKKMNNTYQLMFSGTLLAAWSYVWSFAHLGLDLRIYAKSIRDSSISLSEVEEAIDLNRKISKAR